MHFTLHASLVSGTSILSVFQSFWRWAHEGSCAARSASGRESIGDMRGHPCSDDGRRAEEAGVEPPAAGGDDRRHRFPPLRLQQNLASQREQKDQHTFCHGCFWCMQDRAPWHQNNRKMPFCCHSYREIKFPSVVFQLKKAMANTHKKKAMARAEYFQGAKKKNQKLIQFMMLVLGLNSCGAQHASLTASVWRRNLWEAFYPSFTLFFPNFLKQWRLVTLKSWSYLYQTRMFLQQLGMQVPFFFGLIGRSKTW